MDHEVPSPSRPAPRTARKIASAAPMPTPSVVALMKSVMVPYPLCGRNPYSLIISVRTIKEAESIHLLT